MVEGEDGQWTEKTISVCNHTGLGLEVSGQDANCSCWATAFVGSQVATTCKSYCL